MLNDSSALAITACGGSLLFLQILFDLFDRLKVTFFSNIEAGKRHSVGPSSVLEISNSSSQVAKGVTSTLLDSEMGVVFVELQISFRGLGQALQASRSQQFSSGPTANMGSDLESAENC